MKTLLITLTVLEILALAGVLAFYLIWVSRLLNKIAENLGRASDTARTIAGHAEPIVPDLQRVSRTLAIIGGALPLLHGAAEKILEPGNTAF